MADSTKVEATDPQAMVIALRADGTYRVNFLLEPPEDMDRIRHLDSKMVQVCRLYGFGSMYLHVDESMLDVDWVTFLRAANEETKVRAANEETKDADDS